MCTCGLAWQAQQDEILAGDLDGTFKRPAGHETDQNVNPRL